MNTAVVEAIRSESREDAATQGLVSIVVPCYRGERFLRETLESCLAQTYASLEVVVVDDASPDGCLAIAREFEGRDERVRVVAREKNGGVAQAFNSGFAAARGQYLTRLAQDDLFEPFAVESMVACLKSASPGTGLVYCDQSCIDESGTFLRKSDFPSPDVALRYYNLIGVCVMFTREVWDTVGSFSTEFDAAEDYDYWTRVVDRFAIVKCEGPPALRFREHTGMGSIVSAEKQVANTFKIIKALSARRPGTWSNWLDGQVRRSLGHLMAVGSFSEQKSYWRALKHMVLSFWNWPGVYPAVLTKGRKPLLRCRRSVILLWDLFRSLGLRQPIVKKEALARE
jgi:glycosyltransferase involved in cell wall biosynthesis